MDSDSLFLCLEEAVLLPGWGTLLVRLAKKRRRSFTARPPTTSRSALH